jgi:hypothetical protein
MSLFKLKDCWSTKVASSEEFERGGLCAANFGPSSNGQGKCALFHCTECNEGVKIAVGSVTGYIRLYQPQASEFKAEHLLLEKNLEAPILQLEAGYFIP